MMGNIPDKLVSELQEEVAALREQVEQFKRTSLIKAAYARGFEQAREMAARVCDEHDFADHAAKAIRALKGAE